MNARKRAELCAYDRADFESDERDARLEELQKKDNRGELLSLWEHCMLELGSTDEKKVREYLNRHYGHG